ncbi:hypothetical protein [Micromonospora sp. KC606]|uniref:hypothetical protein n=1 Tax=Micromonospora sp. KC606 TaxID=2530379 RepID=UPI001A9F2082|nr:hypothetical protein [Micromonospora sp. KC606]
MPAGRWWRNVDQDPAAEVMGAEKLAVMEWLVQPDRRGHGIGAELMRRLLADPARTVGHPSLQPRRPRTRRVAAGSPRTRVGPAMDLLVLRLDGVQGS